MNNFKILVLVACQALFFLSNKAFSQPSSKEFDNTLTIHEILANDSSRIVVCPNFDGYEFDDPSRYTISYYTVNIGLDSIQEKKPIRNSNWKCSYVMHKANEACMKKPDEKHYPNRDSIYNYWAAFAQIADSDSLFSVFFSNTSLDSLVHSRITEELYGGYHFRIGKYDNEMIVIKDQHLGEQMKILIVGHIRFPEFTLESVHFQSGTFIINLNESEEIKYEGHVMEYIVKTPVRI